MRPWAAFSASDINNDNSLDIAELSKLFWVLDGVKPDQSRVEREMKIIDDDGSGEIDRLEWMMYLVTPDPDSGLAVFDLNLRELFNRHDKNKDGMINT